MVFVCKSSKMATRIIKCAVTLILLSSLTFGSEVDPAYNLEILGKVMRGICWYETVRKIPPPVGHMELDHCIHYANMPEQSFIDYPDKVDWDYILTDGLHGSAFGMGYEYNTCTKYWRHPDETLDREYYENLGDRENYMFRTLVHCLLHALQDRHGSTAISDVISYWKEPTTFLLAMWNRENELRAHHRVPKLLLDNELTKQAQLIAEEMAEAGKNGDIPSKYRDSMYQVGADNFERVGESVDELEWAWSIPVTVDMVGAVVANKWYSENEQYPWPAFSGTGDMKNFARFTQQVWKDSKRVGYGYVLKRGLPEFVTVVARYWPTGNPTDEASLHLYEKNVLPAKEA